MPDTYGVEHADVAKELPGLFPSGFGPSTLVTAATVASFIASADRVVTLHVERAASVVPAATDAAAPLAVRYIITRTIELVMRAIYAGQDPQRVQGIYATFGKDADDLLAEIDELGIQAAGSGGPPPSRMLGVDQSLVRDLVVSDEDLGGLLSPFPGVSRRRQF